MPRPLTLRTVPVLLALPCMLALPGAMAGQGTATPPADTVIQIPPIEVTVLRSPLTGARTPYAVAGLDASDLGRSREAAFLGDALVALPGLEIQNRHNLAVGERVTVRGFGARAQFGVRGLRVIVDGIPATLPDGQTTIDHLDLASLGRVELLRGPGSALYGNGAGGVLVLESRTPAVGTHVVLRGSGGSDGLVEGSVQLEHGTADGAGTLASASRFGYDGFRSDPVEGGTYGEASRWTVNARHTRPVAGGTFAVTVAGVDLEAENPGSLPSDSLGDPDRSAWGFNVRQGAGKSIRQGQVGAAWHGPLSRLEGELATWGVTRDLRNPIPSDVIGLERISGGVRAALAGDAVGLRWGAGLDLEAMRDDRTNHVNEAGEEGELTLDQQETVRSLGLHVRVAGELGPASLHAALRHDRVRFEADDRFVELDGTDDSGVRTLTAWSPTAGALVSASERLDLFASVSTFLETPTTTELANRPEGAGGFNPTLEPTRGWTLEAGLRGRVGGGLGWELVGFRTELRDELVPFEVPASPGRTFFRNAGRSRHQGLEAALRASLAPGLTARAAYTRVDARFRTPAGDAEEDDRIPGRAPHRLEGLVEAELGPLRGAVDVAWSGAIPVDDADTVEAPASTLVGLRVGAAGWRAGGALLSPYLSVRNLLDEDYVASVVPNAFGGRFFEPGPGRELRVGMAVVLGGSR